MSDNMKKIGIILREFTENNIPFMGNRFDLWKILNEFDVECIGIPISFEFDKIKRSINDCDGIILPGGSVFYENDFKIIDYLYKKNIPTLGICLGMQSMAEYFNNKQEIEVKNHYQTEKYVHLVRIKKDTLLYKIMGKERIMVNSRHHSAIPYTTLTINAISPDGIIEGVEDITKKFFLGVQWHPETLNDNDSYLLFKYFISILK